MFKSLIIYVVLGVFLFVLKPMATQAETACQIVEKKKIKVEGYISKEFRKDKRKIAKEFTEMGDTRTALRAFPMGKVRMLLQWVVAYLHILLGMF